MGKKFFLVSKCNILIIINAFVLVLLKSETFSSHHENKGQKKSLTIEPLLCYSFLKTLRRNWKAMNHVLWYMFPRLPALNRAYRNWNRCTNHWLKWRVANLRPDDQYYWQPYPAFFVNVKELSKRSSMPSWHILSHNI